MFAALDLGTNNCRLLVARRDCHAERGFRVVDAFSRVVRLGEGLGQSGRLSDAAIGRALGALSVCAGKLARWRVARVRSVATEACRRARNGREFVRRVYEETGLALDVISPAEEGRLAVLGCQALVDENARRTMVFDIGGGSTEVVLLERLPAGGACVSHRILLSLSVPWGVVSLWETEERDAGCPEQRMSAYHRMKERVAVHLQPRSEAFGGELGFLGTSGTVTTLAGLSMGLRQYDRRLVDGALVSTVDLVGIGRDLARKSPEERALIPVIGSDRADLIVAGAAILEALTDLGGAASVRQASVRVADRGIREGILRSLMHERASEGQTAERLLV